MIFRQRLGDHLKIRISYTMHVALPYSNIDYVTNYTVVKSSG